MPIPCQWDVACAMCEGWEDYPDAVRDRALWLASSFLWAATGRRFGICPITVRPNQTHRGELLYQTFEASSGDGLGVPGGPFLFGGHWFNAGCASACCGNRACAIVLRGPVADVAEVLVDGEEVPPSAYRVDVTGGAYLLVRTDGECWPTCQNFTLATTEDGTFEVTYGIGTALPPALQIATSDLACEYAKSISGGACKLPAKMTRLSRQGVEIQVEPPEPGQGRTGLRQVDDVIALLNPNGRQRPPVLLSPDLPENCDRVTVWAGGS